MAELDCTHPLGFTVLIHPRREGFAPLGGPCIVVVARRYSVDTELIQWRESIYGVMVYEIALPPLTYYNGALVYQNEKWVGVVQSTCSDIWMFPADLCLVHPPARFPVPLRLLSNNYSLTYRLYIHNIPDVRRVDFAALEGTPLALMVSDTEDGPMREIPAKTMPALCKMPNYQICFRMGDIVIHPGVLVASGMRKTGRVTYFNGQFLPTMDHLLELARESSNILAVEDDICPFSLPAIPVHDVRPGMRVVHGVIIWGEVRDEEEEEELEEEETRGAETAETEETEEPPSALSEEEEEPEDDVLSYESEFGVDD